MNLLLLAFTALLPAAGCLAQDATRISDEQAMEIGKKVWMNESHQTIDGLTDFDKGEGCDLGIGHFIWYPENLSTLPFDESFPKFLAFARAHNAAIPAWVNEAQRCPWHNSDEFKAEFKSPKMVELRTWLTDTIGLQARFMADRMETSLPKILAAVRPDQQDAVRRQFERMTKDPRGFYPLVDYVDFKGEGVKVTERYKGEGWGLLQVLQGMSGVEPGQPALDEFSLSAEKRLTLRVKNSPPSKNEAKWLPIWKRRVRTYRNP